MKLFHYLLILSFIGLAGCGQTIKTSNFSKRKYLDGSSKRSGKLILNKSKFANYKIYAKNDNTDFVWCSEEQLTVPPADSTKECNSEKLWPIDEIYRLLLNENQELQYDDFVELYNTDNFDKALRLSRFTNKPEADFYYAMLNYKIYNNPRYVVEKKLRSREWEYANMSFREYRDYYMERAKLFKKSYDDKVLTKIEHCDSFLNCIDTKFLSEDYLMQISNEAEFIELKKEQQEWLSSEKGAIAKSDRDEQARIEKTEKSEKVWEEDRRKEQAKNEKKDEVREGYKNLGLIILLCTGVGAVVIGLATLIYFWWHGNK